MNKIKCNSMVDPLRRVIMKNPETAWKSTNNIKKYWKNLNFISEPKFDKAVFQYNKLISLIESFGIEILMLPRDEETDLDSIYTHDAGIATSTGIIICNMGKETRKNETKALKSFLIHNNIPVIGEIKFPGIIEGGDAIWINEHTIAVGQGYRTNKEGIQQLKEILRSQVVDIIPVPLPHYLGPENCLHLMSNVSPIDHDLFLIYPKLLPARFIEFLKSVNIKLINVPDEEYESMACNVLSLAPKKCIMMSGNPITKSLLESNNVEVFTYDGSEISLKGAGGPTCLTRPIYRQR
ncbi:MAG: arginine deiminase family protein [Candidatus Marinimicrobia bacterium]|nr:arginine deiminase family protein [Candidatus Neomarinimicrobiota bacterium]